VEAVVPKRGRILEVGCGYGVFSCHLALSSPDRTICGVDVDVRKVVHGQRAARQAGPRGARCEFHLSPPGEIPDGPWDAIVIVDVLYLLDSDAQAGLLQTCAEQLSLGGVLVVKEMATSPVWKARWNTVQETLAVRVLNWTAGEELTFLEPEVLGRWMEQDGLTVTHQPLDRGYPHPHHLIVGARRRSVG
jgi:2-polyprenyl-3-methyl-5-hydroxy-6-metoxy-1,4-benzoquinol methylase